MENEFWGGVGAGFQEPCRGAGSCAEQGVALIEHPVQDHGHP